MTARGWGADVVVALLDYGTEYEQEPSAAQKTLTAEIRANGVDVILGYQARVIQPIDHMLAPAPRPAKQTYVAYSLGDFLSNQEVDNPDSGMIAYLHLEKSGLRTYVTGVSYLPVYTQAATQETPAKYRILPVLPGLEPSTDVLLTADDKQRMATEWEQVRNQLYRPGENISPLVPADLGL
jgi:poly-gamma-glutamate synthesis protein (capsule biosynthesis protein)